MTVFWKYMFYSDNKHVSSIWKRDTAKKLEICVYHSDGIEHRESVWLDWSADTLEAERVDHPNTEISRIRKDDLFLEMI
jgi:hypothetical protein